MKIGFGFLNSIRDIVLGLVALDDVIMVVCRTKMLTIGDVAKVIEADRDNYFLDLDYEACLTAARALWTSGRLHQPRVYGVFGMTVPDDCLWMDVVPSTVSKNPTIQLAWETYRVALRLGEHVPTFEGKA